MTAIQKPVCVDRALHILRNMVYVRPSFCLSLSLALSLVSVSCFCFCFFAQSLSDENSV